VLFDMGLVEFFSISLWAIVGFLVIFAFAGLYSTDPNRKFARDLARVFVSCTIGLAAISVYIVFSQQLFDSRFLILAGWVFAMLYVSAGRFFIRGVKALLYRMGSGLRRVVIIGSGSVAENIGAVLKKRKELGYQVVRVADHFSHTTAKHIGKLDVDELIFTNPRANEREALQAIDFCNRHHIVFKYSADLFATYSANMSVNPLGGVPVIELKRTRLEGWGRVVKRVSDILVSVFMIILTSPIALAAALIILFETGRPVIYKNERVGIRGRTFFMFKFRSMHQKDSTGPQFGVDGKKAEEREKQLIKKLGTREGPIYKIGQDPRVTRFGRFLRRWSIDELPQFFNVLAGDMSLVGPRPHQPREVEKYEERYGQVFTLKPGITGLAQISGRSDLSFEEEMKLDVLYIEKWSMFLDIIIFLKTPFILFKKRKAL
jgi:exopolysaccharide biosynthesis polyprenyl glycosylphosphotransferase